MDFRYAAISLALIPLSGLGAAQSPLCSAQLLSGRYVFTGRGYIEPIEPAVERVHYGYFLFDGAGSLSGKQSSSRGGRIGREDLAGVYAINADCSGTMTFWFTAAPDTKTNWDVYVTAGGRTGHMVRMDAGTMAVRSFER